MEITQHRTARAQVVSVAGHINGRNSSQLRAVLRDMLNRQEKAIVLDLSNLASVDSSGVATFLECQGSAWCYGGDFRM